MSQVGVFSSSGGGGGGGVLTLSDGTTTVSPNGSGTIALIQGADANIVTTADPLTNDINFQLSPNIFISGSVYPSGNIELPLSSGGAGVGVVAFGGEASLYNDVNNNLYLQAAVNSQAAGGTDNISFGILNLAGFELTGSFNEALGYFCLGGIQTGDFNLALGYGSGSSYTSDESNNILISTNGVEVVGESNVLRIGAGTGTGQEELEKAFISGIQTIGITGTPVLVSTTNQLGVAVSSERFKKEIRDVGSSSEVIHSLRPVTFTWKNDSLPGLKEADTTRQYGLIAEEVDTVMPDIVRKDEKGRPFTVSYQDLITPLLNEVQRLTKRVGELESRPICSCVKKGR